MLAISEVAAAMGLKFRPYDIRVAARILRERGYEVWTMHSPGSGGRRAFTDAPLQEVEAALKAAGARPEEPTVRVVHVADDRAQRALRALERRCRLLPSHLLVSGKWTELVATERALRALERLSSEQLQLVWKALALYCQNQAHPGLRVKAAGPSHGQLRNCHYMRASDNLRLFFKHRGDCFHLEDVVVKVG